MWDGYSWCWVAQRCLGIAFGAPQRPWPTIGCSYATHDLLLARDGFCSHSAVVSRCQYFVILFFLLCSGTRTLRKGGVMIRLLYFWQGLYILFATYHVGTFLYISLFFGFVHSTHCVVVGLVYY